MVTPLRGSLILVQGEMIMSVVKWLLEVAEPKGSNGTVCAPGVEGLRYLSTKKRNKFFN